MAGGHLSSTPKLPLLDQAVGVGHYFMQSCGGMKTLTELQTEVRTPLKSSRGVCTTFGSHSIDLNGIICPSAISQGNDVYFFLTDGTLQITWQSAGNLKVLLQEGLVQILEKRLHSW